MNNLAGAAGTQLLLQRLGLPPGFHTFGSQLSGAGTLSNKNEIVISSSPGDSDVPVLLMPVASVQELKQRAGVADSADDSHIDYPPAIPARLQVLLQNAASRGMLLAGLTEADKSLLRKASIAYMMGHSAKVVDYEAIINAALFPGQLAVAVGDVLDVMNADRIVISGSDFMVFNCGKLITASGVEVNVQSDSLICIDYIGTGNELAAGDASANVFNYIGEPYAKAADQGVKGIDGDTGTKGTDGTTQYNGGTCKDECKQPPTDGSPGADGGVGGTGQPGSKGIQGRSGQLVLGKVEGDLTINAGGGTGQQGGKGGTGGTGGPGGQPGSKPSQCSTAAKQGPQGRGGKGGPGNNGGNGGDPCTVEVFCTSVSGQIYTNAIEGAGGKAGLGGDPGAGTGNNGEGQPGINGKNSTTSTIKVTTGDSETTYTSFFNKQNAMPPLSAVQHAQYEAMNQRLGLPAGFRTDYGEVSSPTRNGRDIVISSEPDASDVPVLLVPIGSIAELKAAIGRADNEDDSVVNYPAPLPPEQLNLVHTVRSRAELFSKLPDSSIAAIQQAATAWLLGKPSKLATFEPLINATFFPGQIAYAAGETLVVPDNISLVMSGTDLLVVNYKTIQLGTGSMLNVFASGLVVTQQIGRPAAGSTAAVDDVVVNCFGTDYTEAAGTGNTGAVGARGTQGTPGTTEYDGGSCTYKCKAQPGNGNDGGEGSKGGEGILGLKGRSATDNVFNLGDIKGNLTINAGGGKGQKGGKGGTGGDGGPAGLPGSKPDQCSTTASPGKQGPGGQGGDGNNGGDGGDGGVVIVNYTSLSGQIFTNPIAGAGGDPGDPGEPGNGNGNKGKGNPGKKGNPGTLPNIKTYKV